MAYMHFSDMKLYIVFFYKFSNKKHNQKASKRNSFTSGSIDTLVRNGCANFLQDLLGAVIDLLALRASSIRSTRRFENDNDDDGDSNNESTGRWDRILDRT